MIRALLVGAAVATLLVPLTGRTSAQTNGVMTQEGSDMWRASKLSGVAIYGPGNRKVGNISDVLMDHSGKATAVVVGSAGSSASARKMSPCPTTKCTLRISR